MTSSAPNEDLKWYAVNAEGKPVCEVCGAAGQTVNVIHQVVVGEPPHVAVTEQVYLFGPCGHQNVVNLPDPLGM